MEMKKDDDPPVFSLNWQIYRISRPLIGPSTREEPPQRRSRTKLWIAFGVSVLSIATLFMVMPELADVPKLTTCIGNKLTNILELIRHTLSSI